VRLQRAHLQRIEIGFASSFASPVFFVRAVSTRISIDIEREAHVERVHPSIPSDAAADCLALSGTDQRFCATE
jgi:hypothetical protein